MTPEQLKDLIARSASSPVHVHTTDGATYVITHPVLALISRSMIVIGTGLDHPLTGIPERIAFCPIDQIARVETFPKPA